MKCTLKERSCFKKKYRFDLFNILLYHKTSKNCKISVSHTTEFTVLFSFMLHV